MASSAAGSAVSRDRLWDHLRHLCEVIGPRLSGTELTLLSSDGPERLEALAQTFTQGCDVEAELAVVGTRHELEFRRDLEGKLLVVHTEAAAIVVCPVEVVASKVVRDPFLRVPVAAVAESVGRVLLGREGEVARLRLHARRFDIRSHDVIAHLPGSVDGRLVMGAHYDTAAGTPAAFDDASGTAVILELCETLARFPRYTVDDEPILGSHHVPFLLHGVPVVVFMNEYRSIPIHTPLDTLSVLDPAELEHSAVTVEALARLLSGTDG